MACLLIFSLSISTVFASKPEKTDNKDKASVPVNTENKLSEEELGRMTKRVEEIREMDKSDLTAKEKKELKKELKGIKEAVKADGGYIYIGAGTLLVVILLVILLL